MSELRTKIAKRLQELMGYHCPNTTDDILAMLPDISGIEWKGKCDWPPCDKGKIWQLQSKSPTKPTDCPKCNGTGTITRPATIEEVIEGCKQMIECLLLIDVVKGIDLFTVELAVKEAITINNGTLRIKDKP